MTETELIEMQERIEEIEQMADHLQALISKGIDDLVGGVEVRQNIRNARIELAMMERSLTGKLDS